jgi:hypothetical protein
MGLDMYLYKKHYVQNWEHQTPEERHTITIKKGNDVREDIKPERIACVTEQIGYWRKFNALHNWLIDECAEGEDDRNEIYVSSDKLLELLDTLKEVKKVIDKAKKKKVKVQTGWSNKGNTYAEIEVYDCDEKLEQLLPTKSGFFFGSTQYDDWYKTDVEKTIELLENELVDVDKYDYYYQASW